MTYSIEGLLFKAAASVVNTAARGANAALQIMYPVDIGHVWDDSPPVSSAGGAAPTDPPSGGVADPAGGAAFVPPLSPPPAGSLTWRGWSLPAVLECLAEHRFEGSGEFDPDGACSCGFHPANLYDWHEHIGPIITDRIACNPVKAVEALQTLQPQE